MSKLSLTEATMLALQGKLEESKPAIHRRSKKQENIDVNVDDKTAVSVIGNETIVDTEKATIIVDKKEDEFTPETSDGIVDDTSLPMEAPNEDVVEVPVDGDETIIPEDEVEQADEDEAVLDAEADVDLPLADTETENEEDEEDKEESKKVESVEIEVSDDGKEVEVTTDNGEEVEVKDETPEENEEDNDTESEDEISIEVPEDVEIPEDVEESKKVESKDKYTLDNIDDAIHNIRSKIAKQRNYDRRRDAVCLSIGDDDAVYKPMYDELKKLNAIKKDLLAKEDNKTESKTIKKEDIEKPAEDIYKSSNLFKALCDEVEDITCQDGEKPSREQIEEAVDTVINGYDSIWEDLHTALKTEIDKITGYDEETDSFKPRYEAKSHRKSLGKVTEKVIKYSSKTFKEALNKYYTTNTKTIESVDLTKFSAGRNFIKMEVKLTNKDGMVASKILEMKEIARNKNFTKYAMIENSKIKKESKSNISMLVATNKDKVLECKYIKK